MRVRCARTVRVAPMVELRGGELRGGYCAVQPPSTTIAWPLMLRAAGEIKKEVIAASSSTPMKTPFGIGFSMTSLITSDSGMPRVKAVRARRA